MPVLNLDGTQHFGNIDPATYCLTTDQIGEILAAAFMKCNESFIAALGIYMTISCILGFGLGCLFMYLYCRKREVDE
jgi:hypothetical protein